MSASDDQRNNPQAEQRLQRLQQNRQMLENQVQALRNDEAWVHWEYSPEEWALFDTIDWQPKRRVVFWSLISLFTLGIGAGAYAVSGFGSAILAFVVVALGMLFFFWLSRYTGARKRHLARQKSVQPHKITISREGLWEAGIYFPLKDLARVEMTPRPPVLHFRSTTVSTSTAESDVAASYRLRVLVPRGQEEEAANLVLRFRTEVIEAREQARKHALNPPEPRKEPQS
jgi:hypothetical protein